MSFPWSGVLIAPTAFALWSILLQAWPSDKLGYRDYGRKGKYASLAKLVQKDGKEYCMFLRVDENVKFQVLMSKKDSSDGSTCRKIRAQVARAWYDEKRKQAKETEKGDEKEKPEKEEEMDLKHSIYTCMAHRFHECLEHRTILTPFVLLLNEGILSEGETVDGLCQLAATLLSTHKAGDTLKANTQEEWARRVYLVLKQVFAKRASFLKPLLPVIDEDGHATKFDKV